MKTILIVEDDLDLSGALYIWLRNKGYNVYQLQDGGKLLPTLLDIHPDLVIMDIYLSGHDGRLLVNYLKRTLQFKDIPVLLMSAGSFSNEEIQKFAGEAFIRKPFVLDDLSKKIAEFIH